MDELYDKKLEERLAHERELEKKEMDGLYDKKMEEKIA